MPNPIKLTLSGKFYTPAWLVFDEKSRKFLADSQLVKLSEATEFENEDQAKAEVTWLVQHGHEYGLPNNMALRVVSKLEARSL